MRELVQARVLAAHNQGDGVGLALLDVLHRGTGVGHERQRHHPLRLQLGELSALYVEEAETRATMLDTQCRGGEITYSKKYLLSRTARKKGANLQKKFSDRFFVNLHHLS